MQTIKKALTVVTAVGVAGMVTLGAGTAHAAEYCSALPDPTTNADGLSTTDVTFRGIASNDCYGIGSGNPNSLADFSGLWGGGWEAHVKDDGAPGTVSYLGLDWTLNAPNNVSSGSWTLSITDPPPVSLPVTVDLVAVLKGATSWAAYLFTAQLFVVEGPNTGTFSIQFLNNGGNIPDLSHMDVLLRPAITTVPEPASLLLLGLGLAFAASSRRLQRRGTIA